MEFTINSITLTCYIKNCTFDLINISKFLEIDNDIIGIKCNYCLKGIYLTQYYKHSKTKKSKINTILFNNQISIIIKWIPPEQTHARDFNLKLFSNGTIQITGCKTTNEGFLLSNIVIDKLNKYKNMYIPVLLIKDKNGIYIDKDLYIYNKDCKIIGWKIITENNCYMIKNIKYYAETSFINQSPCVFIPIDKKNKDIIDINGTKIGSTVIKKNDYTQEKNKQLLVFNNILKDPEYHSTDPEVNQEHSKKSLTLCKLIDYNCVCNYVIDSPKIHVNINCININISLSYTINRQKFHEFLLNNSYTSIYNPYRYAGIKLLLKINEYKTNYSDLSKNKENKGHGVCVCNTKCVCSNITYMIFQSGNIIGSGFKSVESIYYINTILYKLLNDYNTAC